MCKIVKSMYKIGKKWKLYIRFWEKVWWEILNSWNYMNKSDEILILYIRCNEDLEVWEWKSLWTYVQNCKNDEIVHKNRSFLDFEFGGKLFLYVQKTKLSQIVHKFSEKIISGVIFGFALGYGATPKASTAASEEDGALAELRNTRPNKKGLTRK